MSRRPIPTVLKIALSTVAVTVVSIGAMAQTSYGSDVARLAGSQARAEAALASTFERPTLETVNPGDYRAEARNEARIAGFYRFHRSLWEYQDGLRSVPIAVNSTTSAREEAARVNAERQLALYVAYLQASPAARLAHQAAMAEQGLVAMK